MKLADHAGHTLAQLAIADDRLTVLDGDLADSDGAAAFAHRHPDRFLMAGISEQNMISFAAGMATTGAIPFVFSFSAFLTCRAFDQIRVCLSQAMQHVVLIGSHSGGLGGRNGKTHAALNDIALMRSLPHMSVWAPGDFADVEFAMKECIRVSGPAYLRLPRRDFTAADNLSGTAAPIRWLAPRNALTIISTGLASHWAVSAAQKLHARGVPCGVLHCLHIAPAAALKTEVRGVQRLVTLEDHYISGGLGTLIAEIHPGAPLLRLGWAPDFAGKSGSDDELLNRAELSVDHIVRQILQWLSCELRPLNGATDDDLLLRLTTIWQQVFGLDAIGPEDNFFELGGNSFLAARIADSVSRQCGLPIAFEAIFTSPTIRSLSSHVKSKALLRTPILAATVPAT